MFVLQEAFLGFGFAQGVGFLESYEGLKRNLVRGVEGFGSLSSGFYDEVL